MAQKGHGKTSAERRATPVRLTSRYDTEAAERCDRMKNEDMSSSETQSEPSQCRVLLFVQSCLLGSHGTRPHPFTENARSTPPNSHSDAREGVPSVSLKKETTRSTYPWPIRWNDWICSAPGTNQVCTCASGAWEAA